HRDAGDFAIGADLDHGRRIDDTLDSTVDDEDPFPRGRTLPADDVHAGLRSRTNVQRHALALAVDDTFGGASKCLRLYLTVMVCPHRQKSAPCRLVERIGGILDGNPGRAGVRSAERSEAERCNESE